MVTTPTPYARTDRNSGVVGARGGSGNNTNPPSPPRADIYSRAAVRTVGTELSCCKDKLIGGMGNQVTLYNSDHKQGRREVGVNTYSWGRGK